MRRVLWCCLASLLLLLCACNKGAETGENPENDDGEVNAAIVTVDGEAVSVAEFTYLLASLIQEYTVFSDEAIDWDAEIDGMPTAEFFRSTALRQAVMARAITRKAGEMDILPDTAEEDDIRAYIEQEIAFLGGEEAFDAYLNGLGTDRKTHELYSYRMPMLSEKLSAALFDEGGSQYPSEETLKAFAAEYFHNYSYIYLSALDDMGNPPDADGYASMRASAEALRAEAASGADFTELIRSHGDDYLMLLTPEGMVVPRGQNGDIFDEAAAALAVGELSPVVEEEAGFYIILRRPDDPGWYAENRDTALYAYRSDSFDRLLEQWCEESVVELSEDYTSLDVKSYAPKG